MLLLGGYALFRPGMTVSAFVQVIGVFVIVDGLFAVIAGITGDVPSGGWTILRGGLMVLAGAFVFANPVIIAGITATVLVTIVALLSVLSGVFEIVAAIQDRRRIEGELWLILSGTLSVVFGLLLLAAPLSFGLFVVRVMGAFAILSGITLIVYAFRLRGLGRSLDR